ncbi:MAG: cobalamin B12-binding domain-containing protein, partial [Candidatus Methanomethylicia archaeon]
MVRNHDKENINTRLPESINKSQGVYPPLGLAYIASVLEKRGHDVSILDAQALNLTKSEVKKNIKKFNPDVVGITSMTPNFRGALEV